MWIYLGLLSAFFLGFYNICKKISVQGNAVIPVLWLTTASGLLGLAPLYFASVFELGAISESSLYIPSLTFSEHCSIAIKSAILAASWLLGFMGLKHLPITIVSPIRSASPFFTLFGAVIIFGEMPNIYQWFGLLSILVAVSLYSKVGKREGIEFLRSKWVYAIVAGTLLGATSGLYDKYLVQYLQLSAQIIQFWFSFYLVILLAGVTIIIWYPHRKKGDPLQWRWSIPLVGLFLVAADFCYFRALEQDGALIVILSALKRSQIFITVFVGGAVFKEQNRKAKLLPLAIILLGVGLILYAQ